MKSSFTRARVVIFNQENEVLFSFKKGIVAYKVDLPGGDFEFNYQLFKNIQSKIKNEINLDIQIKKFTRVWQNIENRNQSGISIVAVANKKNKLFTNNGQYRWINPNDKIFMGYPDWLVEEVFLAESVVAET